MQIKLDLHIDTVNTILVALSKLPYEAVNQHITLIQQQATPQFEAASAAKQAEAAE